MQKLREENLPAVHRNMFGLSAHRCAVAVTCAVAAVIAVVVAAIIAVAAAVVIIAAVIVITAAEIEKNKDNNNPTAAVTVTKIKSTHKKYLLFIRFQEWYALNTSFV